MAEIKPAEVTAILRQELAGYKTQAELEEIGTVLQIGDGIARIYGLNNVESGELIEFQKNGMKAIALNLEADNVGAVLLGESYELKEGDTVKRTRKIASIEVGEGLLGRVINTIGDPIDGKGRILGEKFEMPLERKAPGVMTEAGCFAGIPAVCARAAACQVFVRRSRGIGCICPHLCYTPL